MRYAIAFVCSLLVGCTCGDEKQYKYQFRNESGQRVAVVLDESDKALPDSLVIGPDETYEWVNIAQQNGFFPLRPRREIKVYYGDNVKAVFMPEDARSPEHVDNYTLHKIRKGFYLAVYTFTVGDYEEALHSGTARK